MPQRHKVPTAERPRHDGPVILAGNWEPLIFRRRVGGGSTDVAALYRQEHTETLVRRLEESGVNLLITHYFKGFGLRAEAADIRQARTLIRRCHRHGIRVGGYIGDTMILETLLAEEPEAGSWHQVGPDGTAIHYGGTQTFRFKWCRTNPAFMTYMKRLLTQAIEDGLDLIHFDNFLEKPEPFSCHCRWCTAAFRDFLRSSLTVGERRERLGFADVSRVVPPVFTAPLYVKWGADEIVNPLLQEWVKFRCHILADRYRALADFCRELNPAVALECNPSGIWGENTAYMRGVDHTALLPSGEYFWDESPNPYGLLENGALCTHLRTMKMAEPLGNRVFFYSSLSELALAEGLAFNRGCLGMIGFVAGDRLTADIDQGPAYARWLRERPELFCNTRSVARVAVYRSFTSLAWNSVQPHLEAILAEQTLLEHHIPFDIITCLESLPYDALILPGTECISKAELIFLQAFVSHGGHLILSGAAGRYDGWRRRWPGDPFAEFAEGAGCITRVAALELPEGAPALAERAVWDDYFRVIDGRYWLLPRNAQDLLDALATPRRELLPYEVQAPRTTLVEPRQAADGTLLIHIIHCEPQSRQETLSFALPATQPARRVSWASPERQEEQAIRVRTAGGTRWFSLITNSTYALVIVR